MWTYHPELLATPVPRYTSYPTAAEFHERVGVAEMESGLASVVEETQLSLYLHIPYCKQICWYCGCNTGAANKSGRLASYLEALEREIDLVATRLTGRGKVSRIAFGGGSPNAIGSADFLRIVKRLRSSFASRDAAISVELDVRSLSAAWIEAMEEAGVTRASLGVQTLAHHIQHAIGRVQPRAMIERAVTDLRKAGISSWNFDLMYGLPGQSLEDLEDTLASTLEMRPERISLFGYAHVPGLIPRQRRIDASALPGVRERFDQAAFGYGRICEDGYQPVGFDHFALPSDALAAAAREGRLRRNFQGFTEDDSDRLIGLGASAISGFPEALVQNEKNAGRYRMLLSAGRLPAARGVLRNGEDRHRARIIEQILCRGEASLEGIALSGLLPRLQPFQERELVYLAGSVLRLAPEAIPYARAIASLFDIHRGEQSPRFSNAV